MIYFTDAEIETLDADGWFPMTRNSFEIYSVNDAGGEFNVKYVQLALIKTWDGEFLVKGFSSEKAIIEQEFSSMDDALVYANDLLARVDK